MFCFQRSVNLTDLWEIFIHINGKKSSYIKKHDSTSD